MACSSLSRGYLDNFVCKANEVIFFKLVRNAKDLEEDITANTFHPEYSHQIFGESESIFGYRDLKIRLFYSSSRLVRYMNVSYAEKISPEQSDGVEADDIIAVINEKMEGTFISNIDTFAAALEKEPNFTPFGDLLNVFTIDDKQQLKDGSDANVKRVFEIYKADSSDTAFRNYHDNMQTFLLWFIDAASYIDVEDDKWDYFVLYEKVVSNGIPNGQSCASVIGYHFVGYVTVYRYYAYPENIRPRISQVLVLPPFQRKGLGVRLLESVYGHYKTRNDVIDVTVEDPSENFTRLRDFVDSKNCLKLKNFQREQLLKGWNDEMANEAREKLKLSKRQARRVYEILRLRITDKSNPEDYRRYRLDIKKRLNAPLKRSKQSVEPENEDAKALREIRYESLMLLYNELEEEYQHVIERLAMHGD